MFSQTISTVYLHLLTYSHLPTLILNKHPFHPWLWKPFDFFHCAPPRINWNHARRLAPKPQPLMSAVKKNVKSRQPSQPIFLTPKSAHKMTWLAKFCKISAHSPSDFAFTFFNSSAHPQCQFFVFFSSKFCTNFKKKVGPLLGFKSS